MLKLILMRHAKSSPSDPESDDFERGLSPRGIASAPRMGVALAKRGTLPDRVLCSPAKRARDTLKLVLDAMRIDVPVFYDDSLYAFDDGTAYLRAIARQQNGSSLMLIGHNPSVQGLALRLAVSGDAAALARMRQKFPTAGVAVIALSAENWRQLGRAERGGSLELFLTPKMSEG